ncbi:MAG TPA: creatininase family protein [Pirellulales bacterium]|nr:creatininase family protein [Pirellulales bacterium]
MQLAELSSYAIAELPKATPVVIPLAAMEQHGRHLPLATDSLLCAEVLRRAEERLADRVLVAPLQWLGNSDHHLEFCGTMSAGPRTYLDLLNDVLETFLTHGFRRLVLFNGHGGNDVPARQAIFETRQRHRRRSDLLLLLTTYWALGSKPQEIEPSLVQRQMGHACEWETSMMLRLRPDLVGDYQSLEPISQTMPLEPAAQGWITPDRSQVGHIGNPSAATAVKGEKLLSIFADDAVAMLERVMAWRAP